MLPYKTGGSFYILSPCLWHSFQKTISLNPERTKEKHNWAKVFLFFKLQRNEVMFWSELGQTFGWNNVFPIHQGTMDQKPVKTSNNVVSPNSVIWPSKSSFLWFKISQIVGLYQCLYRVLKMILAVSSIFFSLGAKFMLRSLATIVFTGELISKKSDSDFQHSSFSLKLTGT